MIRNVMLIFVILFVGTAGAEKLTPALEMDTYTDASDSEQSFGSEGTLWVSSQSGKPMQIAYLTFADMKALPQQISSGSLKMYVKEVEQPGKVSIYLYDQAAMDIITWSDRPEYGPDAMGTLEIQAKGWQTWDARDLVKKAAVECSEGCPFSVVLVADGDASIAFASREGPTDEKPILQYEAF